MSSPSCRRLAPCQPTRPSRWLGAGLLLLSCKTYPPAAPVHAAVQVGRRCAELRTPRGPINPARARVFVELAHLLPNQLPHTVGDWLEHNAVAVRSVSSLLVTPTRPVVIPWGPCLDDGCDTRAQSWAVSLSLTPDAAAPLRLSFQLMPGSGAPSERAESATPNALLTGTLQVASQIPTVFPGASPAVGADELLVTAYLLVEARDLFRLMSCKGEQLGLEELRPLGPAGE